MTDYEPSLAGTFFAFAAYFGAALALTAMFVLIYVWTTPHNEFKLMREGNGAAALGLTGALLGFVIPLALVISVSGSLSQVTIWGAGALLVQTIGQFGARLLFPNLTTDIVAGKFRRQSYSQASRSHWAFCKPRAGFHKCLADQ
jgi:putative membrane protein